MNKNIIIGIIVVALVVVVAGAFFVFRSKEAFDVSFISGDEIELTNWGNDLEVFAKDNTLATEFDQTFGDILDERAVISADAALNESAIAQEASQVDSSQTLNAFAADDAALRELDQVFSEVSQ